MKFLNPEEWKSPKGYSNGVVAEGTLVFVAGQVGWDGSEKMVSENFAAQAKQALSNIVRVLAEAGANPGHIVRMTWYVTSKDEYVRESKELGAAYKEIIGKHYPAMTLVQVAALLEEGAKVEIEATAVIPAN
ncbi:MAG: RidA family protein [Planctomycetes bacterium]|nr:RidA family protein [Planctomycetota bacterium]